MLSSFSLSCRGSRDPSILLRTPPSVPTLLLALSETKTRGRKTHCREVSAKSEGKAQVIPGGDVKFLPHLPWAHEYNISVPLALGT